MVTVGGTTPDTHGRLHGLRRKGCSSPQDEDLRCTVRTARRVPQDIKDDILKMLRDLLGYVQSQDSSNQLLLFGYLLDLTDL